MPYVSIRGARIYYEVKGAGFPMNLLHASPTSHTHWLFQVYYYSRKYKVFNVDVRGHGLSSKGLPKGKADIEDLSEDLNEFFRKMRIKQAIIMGLSLGSIIAQRFGADHPKKVKALILAGSAANLTPAPYQVTYDRRLEALRDKDNPIEKYMDAFFAVPFGAESARMISDEFRQSRLGSYLLDLLKQRAIEELSPQTHIAFNECFRRLDVRLELERVHVPTLVISGGEESIEVVREVHTHIKGSRFKIVSASGHFCCMENPKEFNAYVDEFLASLDKSSKTARGQ